MRLIVREEVKLKQLRDRSMLCWERLKSLLGMDMSLLAGIQNRKDREVK